MKALNFGAVATRAVATAQGKDESRTAKMRAIRAACRRIGLDDEARKDVQLGVTGKASMKDMDLAELGQVLDRLNRDWKGPSGHGSHAGKIRAVWWTLYWIGAVDKPNDNAISAFVRRMTGVSALRFLDHRGAPRVIEALKDWAAREGVVWPKEPGELGDRRAVVEALWAKLRAAGQVAYPHPGPYAAAALAVTNDPAKWSRHELDAVIRLLGKQVRRSRGKD